MLNIKYYIVLLIGVFLALGLGVLVGISLENKDILQNQQVLLAKQIEQEFNSIRNETELIRNNYSQLEQEKKQADSLCNILFTETVRDRLKDVKVSIIETSEYYPYSDIISLLKLAGVSIESNFTIDSQIYNHNSQADLALDVFNQPSAKDEELMEYIAHDIVDSICYGRIGPFVDKLRQYDLIKTLTDIQDCSDVIILCGSGCQNNGKVSRMDIELIKAASENGIHIIAIETQNIEKSAIAEYKKLGISTIDNTDTLYGKLALISLMSGNSGNYGQKKGAQSILPDPLFLPYVEPDMSQ